MVAGASAAPWNPTRETICCLLSASLVFPTVGIARADTITTEQVANFAAQRYSDPLQTFLRRSDVNYQLRSLGVEQTSAEKRVAAMTDEELRTVMGKLDSLYAGGQYAPPSAGAAGAAGGVGSGYGAGGAGYGGGSGAVIVLIAGLVGVLNWSSVQTHAGNPGYTISNPLPLDPDRKISEHDCTKPIVFDGGNLRCK